jgi:phage protein D
MPTAIRYKQIIIERDGKSELRVTDADRHKYKSVVAYYHDTASGKWQPVRSGTCEPTFSMKFSCPTKAQADEKLKTLERQIRVLTVSMPGDLRVVAESSLLVTGFRPGVNGSWGATKAIHRFSNSGYRTSIEDAEQTLSNS